MVKLQPVGSVQPLPSGQVLVDRPWPLIVANLELKGRTRFQSEASWGEVSWSKVGVWWPDRCRSGPGCWDRTTLSPKVNSQAVAFFPSCF